VFNGTQPGNDGCDGHGTINCGIGTTLMDCIIGPRRNFYISDAPKYFLWNRTSSVNQQVSVVFSFDQQVDIRRIIMIFYNSPSNNIMIPNLVFYWSNDDSSIPSNQISFNKTDLFHRDRERQCKLNLNINHDGGISLQYFRIVMSFYDDSEWIFLSEVFFCGK